MELDDDENDEFDACENCFHERGHHLDDNECLDTYNGKACECKHYSWPK